MPFSKLMVSSSCTSPLASRAETSPSNRKLNLACGFQYNVLVVLNAPSLSLTPPLTNAPLQKNRSEPKQGKHLPPCESAVRHVDDHFKRISPWFACPWPRRHPIDLNLGQRKEGHEMVKCTIVPQPGSDPQDVCTHARKRRR